MRWEIVKTGGGCRALVHKMGEQGQLVIVNEDGTDLPRIEEPCLLCVEDASGEELVCLRFKSAIHARKAIVR